MAKSKSCILAVIILLISFFAVGIQSKDVYAAVENVNINTADTEENSAIQKINSGNGTIEDYNVLGLNSVKSYGVDIVNREILKERSAKGNDLTKEEIKNVVNNVIDKISDIATKINKGQATVDDYKYIGINDVTQTNLGDVNEWIKGKLDITQLKGEINLVIKALRNINDGQATLSDFQLLQLENVDNSNLQIIENKVVEKRAAKGDDLTRAEIKKIIDDNLSFNNLLEKIRKGEGTKADYESIGITGVTDINLDAVNGYVKGKDFTDKDSLQVYVNAAVNALININEGKDTLDDYIILNIQGVTEVNIDAIRNNIRVYRSNKGAYLSKAEIIECVNNTIHFLSAFDRINAGTASVDDYVYIGITGVTIDNLAVVNANVRGGNFTEVSVLQVRVNTIIEIYNSMIKINGIYVRISNGEATLEDYTYIGVTGVTVDNLSFVNAKIKGVVYTNSTDVQIKVTNIVKFYDIYVRINAGTAVLDDYTALGITGVTVDNLFFINANIKGNNYFDVDAVQVKVNELVIKYEAFLKINAGNAELSDYETIGVTGVTVDNLFYVNLHVKGNDYFVLADVQAKVDVLVKEYDAFVRINAGTAVLGDYEIVGITGVTVDNIAYINIHLKGKNYFVTVDLQSEVDILINEFNVYVRINLGEAALDDYSVIGITGVTVDNLIYVNADLKGKGYTTPAEAQARVDAVAAVYESFIRINAGEGTLNDYAALGITVVTSVNLPYVNADLKGKGYLTAIEIKNAVEANLNIYDALYRINHGKGTLNDYRLIGADKVTISNVIYVNGNMRGSNVTTASAAIVKINTIIDIYELNIKITAVIERINKGEATLEDYDFIGAEGVTPANLIYINADLKGKGYVSLDEIQGRINEILPLCNAFIKINAGEATLDDYNTLHLTGVTAQNIAIINADLKGKNYVTAEEIQLRINNNLTIIVLNKINEGNASVDDYAYIGCTNVNEVNLNYVNGALKGFGCFVIDDVKVKVNASVNEYDALAKINLGQGEISDYVYLQIDGVNADNLSYVNLKIKDSNIFVIGDLKVKVDNLVEVYTHLTKINLGNAEVSDYEALGLTSVTVNNLVYVNVELKGKNLIEISDIQAVINNVVRIQLIYDRVNNGEATLDDYNALGIVSVTVDNLNEININVKGKNYRDKDALQDGINKAIVYIGIYNRINLGEGTLDDYNTLGIEKVTVDNLVEVNLALKGKNYRSVNDIQIAVNNFIEINLAYDRINDGTATLDDYNLIGVYGVTVNNLNSVNLSLKGLNYRTKADIQVKVDNVIKIDGIYDRINDGTASADDYAYIGAAKVTVNNIVDINAGLKGKNYRNIDDIVGEIDSILVYVDIYNRINLGEGTLDDYKYLGIDRISVDNLTYVNVALKGANIRNAEEIKVKVNNVIDINLAYDRINLGEGTLDDYKLLGIDRITVDNIVYVNAELKGQNIRNLDDIRIKINNVIDINLALDRINDGTAAVDDYALLGITNVTVNNIVYVNAELKGQNIRVIDDIRVKVNNVVTINDAYDRINNGEGTLDDYTLFGVTDVTVDNIVNINLELKGKNIRDPEELRVEVSNVIKLQVVYDRINNGEGTLDDYKLLGIDRITVDNIAYVNAELKGQNIRVLDTIKVKINNIIDVNIALDRINNGEGTVDDYRLLGIQRVTVDNIVYVNAELKGQNIRVIDDIRVKVNNTININEAYDRINDGTAAVDDYVLLGITNVTVNNIVYVNAELKGQNIRVINDIRVKVNNVVAINDAYDRINDGEGTLDDYTLLHITDVTVDNIINVNLAVKGKNYRDPEKISVEVANVIKFNGIYDRINNGTATVEDYTSLGIENVNEGNLGYVNDELKGQNIRNLGDIKIKVETVVNINSALDRINNGEGTLDDYRLLGVTDVTVDNIVYVNAELKGQNIRVINDIRVKVNNIIVVNTVYDRINGGIATVDDYKALGIDVSVDNLVEVNLKLKGKGYRVVEVIRTHVNNVVKVNIAYDRINEGQGTLDDYKLFGTDVITIDNINYVNIQLKGKNYRDPVIMKENIIKVVNTNKIIIKINNGTAAPEDYTYLNIVNVTVNNVDYINLKLKGKNYVSATEIEAQVNTIIKISEAYEKIKNGSASDEDYAVIGIDVSVENKVDLIKAYNNIKTGEGTLEDYEILGITGVTVDNIAKINVVMPGDEYITIPEIQAAVNTIINVSGILDKINKGNATVGDYAAIGIVGVTEVNIGDVNGTLNGKGYTNPEDIKDIQHEVDSVLYDDFEITVNDSDNTASIKSYTGNNSVVVIPETIVKDNKEYKITEIEGFAFNNCDTVTKIVVPDSVVKIADCAFYEVPNLKTVVLGNKVTSIGEMAFANCSNLSEIVIPDSVTSIGESAFAGCSNLNCITIGENVESIGKMAFTDCTSLKTIIFTKEVSNLGESFLDNCISLTNIIVINSGNGEIENNYGVDLNNYYKVTINGDNYTEVQYVKKGGNSVIFNYEGYNLYDGTEIVDDFAIYEDKTFIIKSIH